jgi:anti-anti-sigma factor
MEIVETQFEKGRVVAVSGRLDAQSSPQLEERLGELFGSGEKALVFDFSKLSYISSAGLRVLLIAGKRAGQGRVILSGLQGHLLDIIEISGFRAFFPVAADVESAIALL